MRERVVHGPVPSAQTPAEWLRARAELPAAPPELHERWDSRWGKYIPAPPREPSGRLRVALISASPIGLGFVPTVLADDSVEVVGLSTDEVIDHGAKISRRRRIWRHLESDSLLLLAPRRIGKTSLMRALCAEGPEHGFRSVSLSFACLFRRKWTAIPAQTGHLIRRKLDGCSR